MKRTFLIVCIGLAAGSAVSLSQRSVPALTGRVVDTADLLSAAGEAALAGTLKAHEDSTSNQIAVLTVPDLGGLSIEEFSMQTAEAWQLGQEDRDNGVLILVSRDDREMRIEVGQGLEGTLPDVLAGRIIRHEFIPSFRDGQYETGIIRGTEAVMQAIGGTYSPRESDGEQMDTGGKILFAGLFYTVVSVMLFGAVTAPLLGRIISFLFFIPFVAAPTYVVTESGYWVVVILVAYGMVFWTFSNSSWAKKRRKKKGATGWFATGSAGGSSGSGWSSGGFSGGGGSFGGGGASGGW